MDKTNYRKAKAKELFDKVVIGVQNIINSGEYEKYLRFQKNFIKYSFNNNVLIYNQFPDATRVAGKKAWRDLGRETIDNATRIMITAGMPKKGQKKVKKIIDGKEVEEIQEYEYMSYRSVHVYDISQTTGEPIPMECKAIGGDDMAYFYEKLKQFSKFPIFEADLQEGLHGFYRPIQKEIVVKNSLSINDKVSVLLHELAHGLYDDFDYKTDRNLSEVFVESIAFIVADYFGLDTSLCSLKYITKYANGDSKVLIDLGTKIQKCAKEFIKDIESFEMQEMEVAA